MLALSGVPGVIGDFFAQGSFGGAGTIFVYLGIIILLGTILDSISILLIMVPLALPVLLAQGVDPIWLGIVTVVAVEIGIITPPLGIGVFVVKDCLGRDDISLGDVFRGAFPFVLIMAAILVILVLFPTITLGLLGR
jgi:C4-dicarboxylate transporter, DctM subunit